MGRSHGHHRALLVTVTGQVSRPPLGRNQWPLTEARGTGPTERSDSVIEKLRASGSCVRCSHWSDYRFGAGKIELAQA